MNNNLVDLHSHTTNSDGTYTPNELLTEAERVGLKIISITDHECVDAYFDFDTSLFSGTIITGIELRTSCFGISIELLGYGFDIKKMKENLDKFKYLNTNTLDKYMAELAYTQYTKHGIKLDSDFIERFDRTKNTRFSKYIQSEMAKHKENIEFTQTIPENKSFFRYCMTNPSHPLFIDLSPAFPSVKELISCIKDAGGFISIPHIFEYKGNAEKILIELLEKYPEIDAIECFYPSFTKDNTEYLLKMCQKYNKYSSGGSDFHGMNRPSTFLGKGIKDNLFVPIELIKKWTDTIPHFSN